MNVILYGPDTTNFDTNGIGILTEAAACQYEGAINSPYEVELKYPTTGQYFASIGLRSIFYASTGPGGRMQPFRVYRISKPMNGIVKYNARHILYDCRKIVCSPFSAPTLPLALLEMKAAATTPCIFSFETDRSTEVAFSCAAPKSIWGNFGGSAGSLLDVYGGEWEFDGLTATLRNRIGENRGVSIRYGKNLNTLEQDENIANTYTGIYPYYMSPEGQLVELPEKILVAEGDFGHTAIIEKDFSADFPETVPTVQELRERAERYMESNEIGIPKVSLKVQFVDLAQTDEYAGWQQLEEVQLGDTISVYFQELGVETTARAVKVKWDCLKDRYLQVEIGSVKANLASTIAEQQKEIDRKPSVGMTEQIAATLAKLFMGVSGGAVRLLDTDGDGSPDELYIADNKDPNLAVRVWRWNYMGWAASASGYNGPFVMGATLEDGILAEAITAANLTAGFIQSMDGSFYLDLDSGALRVAALDEYAKYFHFTINGLIIGEAESPAQVIIDNDEIRIQVNGLDVIRFDALGRAIIPDLTVTQALNVHGIQTEETESHINGVYLGRVDGAEVAAVDAEIFLLSTEEGGELNRSGTFSGSIVDGKYTVRVDWSIAPSAGGGTYVPTLEIYLVQKPWWNLKIGGRTNTATIAGKSYSWKSPAVRNDSVNQTITTHLGTVVGEALEYGQGAVQVSVSYHVKATISETYYGSIEADGNIEAVDYTPPRIWELSAVRCDESGNAAAVGEFAKVVFSAAVSSVENTNTAEYLLRYRPTSGGEYAELPLAAYSGQYAVDGGIAIITASSTNSWEIILETIDSYGSTARTVTLGADEKLWSLLKRAGVIVGAAFGKIAEIAGALELEYVLRPNKGIGMAHYDVSSSAELDLILTAYFAKLSDYSTGNICIVPTDEIEVLGSQAWMVSVYRFDSENGAVEAIDYQSEPPTKKIRGLRDGVWGSWHSEHGSVFGN